jgi:uncharacterized membrane-anchored protein
VLLWGGVIAAIYIAYRFLRAPVVLSFWAAYVLKRPLGASIGDLLSQARADGSLGLGTLATSLIFLGLILVTAGFLFFSKVDVARARAPKTREPVPTDEGMELGGAGGGALAPHARAGSADEGALV